jgi:deoxyguanosine kinase
MPDSADAASKPLYIAIEGVIGVGKTTLARLLGPMFDAGVQLEVFEENPFLKDFYSDRARFAFQVQIFFLLSRYQQQRRLDVSRNVMSDYMFAKDWLFAHLNLAGDEMGLYESVYAALIEKVRVPDLVVYLWADVDTLMARIAYRDRSYERDMDRDYIAALVDAYERYFAAYSETQVLRLDTRNLNYVTDAEALAQVAGLVRAALNLGTYQPPLLNGVASTAPR